MAKVKDIYDAKAIDGTIQDKVSYYDACISSKKFEIDQYNRLVDFKNKIQDDDRSFEMHTAIYYARKIEAATLEIEELTIRKHALLTLKKDISGLKHKAEVKYLFEEES